jgi:hypothetical protein
MQFEIRYIDNKIKGGFIGMNKKAAQELGIHYPHKQNIIEIYKNEEPIMQHTITHEKIEFCLMKKGLTYREAHKIALRYERSEEPLHKILKKIKCSN